MCIAKGEILDDIVAVRSQGDVPTHVGMNLVRQMQRRSPCRCPHARGDEPKVVEILSKMTALSLRPWGHEPLATSRRTMYTTAEASAS